MSFWYCSTPYSKFHGGIEAAYMAACEQAALLIDSGVPCFSPIAHSHPIAMYGSLDPLDHSVWLPADAPMMEAAKGLIVCMLPGWEESYGVGVEIKAFTAAGKPVHYMEPGIVPEEVLPPDRQIIALCGYARSGKNTAADALTADGWRQIAFADPVRESVQALDPICLENGDRLFHFLRDYGWEVAKGIREVRGLLQRMGTEAGRNIHGDDCWIKIAKRTIDATRANVVITDCRFENEAAAVRSWGGTVIRIDRPGVGPLNGHASEKLDFKVDHILVNDGTIDDLHADIRLLASIDKALDEVPA